MDFRYLTETKNEFDNFLNDILVPHLYNGISGMLEYSIQTYNILEEKQKKNKNIQNPGIINIFKMCLEDISSINNNEIENEYKRIKEKSGCGEWFDNLIKASFKSYVLFLTWDPQTSNSKYSDNDFYDKISLKDFIHKCYIETCEYFKENPEIFLKKNAKKEINDIIKNRIEYAIKKTLPYNDIIQEFLNINFTTEIENNKNNKKEIDNIKKLVFRIMSNKKYGSVPTAKALLTDSSDENYNPSEQRQEVQDYIDNNLDVVQTTTNKVSNTENVSRDYKKEIFKPHSQTNSRNNSLKSSQKSETSDNFEVQEVPNNFQQIGGENNITSTQILTRSEVKKKELELVLDENNTKFNKTSDEENKHMPTITANNSNETNQHIDSPLPVKKNNIDRIFENVKNDNLMNGGNSSKRKIEIIKNRSNSIHNKANDIGNYFNNLIKN